MSVFFLTNIKKCIFCEIDAFVTKAMVCFQKDLVFCFSITSVNDLCFSFNGSKINFLLFNHVIHALSLLCVSYCSFAARLESAGQLNHFLNVELTANVTFNRMKQFGVGFDSVKCRQEIDRLKKLLDGLEEQAHRSAGRRFWMGAPKEVAKVSLFFTPKAPKLKNIPLK